MSTQTTTPDYLKDEYQIQDGESRRALLDSLLAWYWTNWSFLRENLYDTTVEQFLTNIDNCKTMKEMKSLVNKYI